MLFVERAKLDLKEMQSIIQNSMAFSYLSAESREYREKLLADIKNAVQQAEVYGDDNLYLLYYKGSKELWVGSIQPLLAKTLQDIEQRKVTRLTCQEMIENKNRKISELEQQLKQQALVNGDLNRQISMLQKWVSENSKSLEASTFATESTDLTSSMLIDLSHAPELAKRHEYASAAVLLKQLEQRCFREITSGPGSRMAPAIIELHNCKSCINTIVAEQILTEIKRQIPEGYTALFFRSNNTGFYKALGELLEESSVDFIQEHKFKTKEDLITFVDLAKQFILKHCQDERWGQSPYEYAQVFLHKTVVEHYQKLALVTEAPGSGSSPSEHRSIKIDELKNIRAKLQLDLEEIRTKLASISQSKPSQLQGYLNKKSYEVINGFINAPLEYIFKVGEMFVSPATAVAKELGKAYAELEQYKKASIDNNNNNTFGEKQIEVYESLYQRLEYTLSIFDMAIEAMEAIRTAEEIKMDNKLTAV